MKAALILAPILLAAGTPVIGPPQPLKEGYDTLNSAARPPERFQGDNAVITVFLRDVTQFCGPPPEGYIKLGCIRADEKGRIIMALPNPCLIPNEAYAHIACNELGHRNGWAADHPR